MDSYNLIAFGAVGVILLILAVVLTIALVITKKKRNKREQRLRAALDEEERQRKAREAQKLASKCEKKEQEPKEEKQLEDLLKEKPPGKESGGMDQVRWILQMEQMEKAMGGPSENANPKDVNKMVKMLQQKRMEKFMKS
uniref:STI1 domain-containing protein n=1 Tax=Angiostrongylus cantonensis TaxID=6313 RepID=A0A0K0D211_ANGCA